ncbi:uncharacterized protein LOC125195796 [Salvia hispanica]|uniref:uncharacterized protein LOC125195796 n=1 Tax=Salvia hispanica TaxID=49212 RepID=UPI0020090CBF|nr:uncharacterized protein LOC125195796 [Salvia hispanica]
MVYLSPLPSSLFMEFMMGQPNAILPLPSTHLSLSSSQFQFHFISPKSLIQRTRGCASYSILRRNRRLSGDSPPLCVAGTTPAPPPLSNSHLVSFPSAKSPLARRDFRVPSARTPSSIEFSFSSERPPASSLPSRRRQQWRGGVASTPCLRNSPPRRVLLCVGASSASPANSPRRSPTSALRPAPASSANLAAERRHRLLLPPSAATCSCSAEVFGLRRRSSVARQPRLCCRRDPQLLCGSSSAPSTLAVARQPFRLRYKAVTWSLMG